MSLFAIQQSRCLWTLALTNVKIEKHHHDYRQKMKVSYWNQTGILCGSFVFLFFIVWENLDMPCTKRMSWIALSVTEFWHAMYKRWGSAVLPDKEVISHTEQVLKDGQEASLILLVRRIHLLQHFKAMISISLLTQLRKSWHMHPTLRDFMKPCSESLNQALNKHGR